LAILPAHGLALKHALIAITVLAGAFVSTGAQATAQESATPSAAKTLDSLRSDQATQARKILLEARAIAESLGNKDKDLVPWESVALAAARAGDAEGAERGLTAVKHVFESHRASNTAVPMPRGAVDIYAETAFELARLGMQAEAYKLIDLAPSTDGKWFALRHLVEAQARVGDIKLAQNTLNHMSQTQSIFSDSTTEIERAKRNIAIAQAESGDVEAASHAAAQIQHPVMKMQAQCALAVAQAEKGNRGAASGTLADVDKEIPPYIEKFGESDLSAIREIVQRAQVRIGDGASALKAAEKLPDQGRQGTKLMLATDLAYEGDVPAAIRIFESYSDLFVSNPNNAISEFLLIVTQRLAVGDKTGAMKMCDFAVGIINHTEGSFQSVLNLARIAVLQGKSGESAIAAKTLAHAMEITSQSKKLQDKYQGYADVAIAQAQLGNFAEANRISRLVLEEPHPGSSLVHVYTEIAKGQMQAKQFDEARKTISSFECLQADMQARDQCLGLKLETVLEVLSEIAKEQAQAKQFGEARKTVSTLECPQGNMQDGCLRGRESTLIRLARTFADLGDVTNTLAWARQQDPSVVRLNALMNVAEGLLDQVNPSANPGQYMSTFDSPDWP